VLAERFRRGKLQKARTGQVLAGRAPYGYRYVHKQDGAMGHLVIDETEADLVRLLFRWLTAERMTCRQIAKRLNAGPWFPRAGQRPWSPSTIHHILSDSACAGTVLRQPLCQRSGAPTTFATGAARTDVPAATPQEGVDPNSGTGDH
jgi:site-specific DNA recombinase